MKDDKTFTFTNVDTKFSKCNKSPLEKQNFYNVNQLGAYTGFSIGYIYKLTHLNKIPFYKPNGGKLLFSKAEIEQWINDSRFSTKAEIESQALLYSLNKKAS